MTLLTTNPQRGKFQSRNPSSQKIHWCRPTSYQKYLTQQDLLFPSSGMWEWKAREQMCLRGKCSGQSVRQAYPGLAGEDPSDVASKGVRVPR